MRCPRVRLGFLLFLGWLPFSAVPAQDGATDRASRFTTKGRELQKLEDHQGAIFDYTEAIRIDPKFAEAYYLRGTAKQALDDTDGALHDYDKAIELNPQDERPFYRRGSVRRDKRDFPGAIEDYSEVIRLAPDNYRGYIQRGRVKHIEGNYAGAIEDYTEAYKREPRLAVALVLRGQAKMAQGEFEDAIGDFNRALLKRANFANAFFERGMAYFRLENYRRARQNIQRAIEADPTRAGFFLSRGVMRYGTNDLEGALMDFAATLRLATEERFRDEPRIWMWLAESRLGDRETADARLRAHLETRPPDPESDWYENLCRFFLGEVSEERLLQELANAFEDNRDKYRSEAFFSAAQRQLVEGNTAAARLLLQETVAFDRWRSFEHQAATLQLVWLNAE